MEQIEARDAQTLVNILTQEQSKDPNFFFRVKFDNEGRIYNIFWRDSMMLEYYRIYGDVLVFDTTYRANRYNLICSPFVGINNHWKNCMFACAFIRDEKTESFVWLLEILLKAMEDKTPTTIFSDQDQAMSNAIKHVLPNTRHRLYIWYLEQNAITRILHLHSVTRIPEKYVTKRWTKFAKSEAWNRLKNQDPTQPYIPWRQIIMRKYYNLILKSQENKETRAFMEESFKNSLKMVEELLATAALREEGVEAASDIPDVAESTQSNNDVSSSSSISTSVSTILDPKRVVIKGRSKRAKTGL
ncbi:protein FAR1-RELATED SEQUENCE 5-like [Chenopodium quinoa]|uniref:protein FAR1-RELATED SEQUENCE 5-like n=1 Tax=Chenopodium quinoa TaxID=63459 RepID=UPI000B790578|nr:protein FAR1-RELATED SEQUENCE 5-like [Chenopodium quinoa]